MCKGRVSAKLVRALLAFMLGILLFACMKEDYDFNKFAGPDLEPVLAVPLIHSTLGIANLLPKGSLIEEDSNQMLTLVYEKELLSLRAEDYIMVPEQHTTFMEDDISILAPAGTIITIPFSRNFTFEPPQSGQRIDSLVIKSAMIALNFSSSINHDCKITLRLPSIRKNGQVFEVTLDHDYSGSIPVSGSQQLDFSNYRVTVNNTGTSMELPMELILEVTGDNNPDLSPYFFQLDLRISQIRFAAIYGYLGQFEYPLHDSIELGIFKNNLEGRFTFGDLRLFLSTTNSIGMPMQLEINEITAFSTKNPPYVVNLIDNPAFPNPLFFPSPDVWQAGQEAETTYVFTPVNCNLNEALHISPRHMNFSVLGKSNPAGNPADENFVLDSSRFSVKARIELPFFGSIEGFVFEDTLDFNFDDIDEVQEFAFRMVTVNRFPFDLRLQAFFTDENFQVLDSLVYENDPHLIHAAAVSGPPDYRVIGNPPPYTYLPQPLTRQRLEKLSTCKKMIFRGGLNTSGNGLVKIYSDYTLDLRMGAVIRFTYQSGK